jgi:hypothetical protein
MYTASNRLGTLSLVAGSRYLSGDPYSLEGDEVGLNSFQITGATLVRGEGVSDSYFVINYQGDTPEGQPSSLDVGGVQVTLSTVVESDPDHNGSITWLTEDQSAFTGSSGNLRGSFSWGGVPFQEDFEEWAPAATPPASLDDVHAHPSGLGMTAALEDSYVEGTVFSQGDLAFAPGSIVRFYTYPGPVLIAKVLTNLGDGYVSAEIRVPSSTEAIVAVGVDINGNELIRSASVRVALEGSGP